MTPVSTGATSTSSRGATSTVTPTRRCVNILHFCRCEGTLRHSTMRMTTFNCLKMGGQAGVKIVKLGDVESLSRPLIRKMVATIKASDSVSNKEGRSRCVCTDATCSVMTQQFYLFVCFC